VAVISGEDPRYVWVDDLIDFYGTNSYDPDGGSIQAYSWIFDRFTSAYDKSGEDTVHMTCRFASLGEDGVSLKVQDDEGTWSEYEHCTIYVVNEYDAEITQCSSSWLPKKQGDSDYKTYITVTVVPDRPTVSKEYEFTLYDVSSEYGYCVNRGSETGKDLQFEPQTGFTISGSNNEIATKTTTSSSVTVAVSSFDYGAYGKIKCEVTIDGQTYTAHIPGGSQTDVSIPRDDDNNHIADAWTYNTGNYGDDDDTSLDNYYYGDGLCRYEEYRGVDINGDGLITCDWRWQERLNPNRKDLFVASNGFGGDFPFAWGNAFNEAEIDVHQLFGGNDRNIDVLSATLADVGYHITQTDRFVRF
jgi:hypothetical protein